MLTPWSSHHERKATAVFLQWQAAMPVGFKGSTQSWTAAEDSVGFKHVDVHVTNVMITWIGRVLEQTCRELLVLNKETTNCKFWKMTVNVEIQTVSIWYYGVWRDSTNLGNVWHVWAFFNLLDIFAVGCGLNADHPPQYLGHVEIIIVGFPHLFQHGYIEKYKSFGTPNTLSSPLICSIFWWSDSVRGCRDPRPTTTQPSGRKSLHKTPEKCTDGFPGHNLSLFFYGLAWWQYRSGFGWVPRLLDRARGESMKKGDCPQIPQARREDFVPGFVKLNSTAPKFSWRGCIDKGSSVARI
jgi:hypothetical protein